MSSLSPACFAAVQGDAEGLIELIAIGHDPEDSDAVGWQPAHWAAAAGSFEAVHALQLKGVRLDANTFSNASPADVANEAGHTELAALIRYFVGRNAPSKRRAISPG